MNFGCSKPVLLKSWLPKITCTLFSSVSKLLKMRRSGSLLKLTVNKICALRYDVDIYSHIYSLPYGASTLPAGHKVVLSTFQNFLFTSATPLPWMIPSDSTAAWLFLLCLYVTLSYFNSWWCIDRQWQRLTGAMLHFYWLWLQVVRWLQWRPVTTHSSNYN